MTDRATTGRSAVSKNQRKETLGADVGNLTVYSHSTAPVANERTKLSCLILRRTDFVHAGP